MNDRLLIDSLYSSIAFYVPKRFSNNDSTSETAMNNDKTIE